VCGNVEIPGHLFVGEGQRSKVLYFFSKRNTLPVLIHFIVNFVLEEHNISLI
jgi:hypothetical protein